MPDKAMSLQAGAQASYLEAIAIAAHKKYADLKNIAFDVQGRVLVDVSLEDIYRAAFKIETAEPIEPIILDRYHTELRLNLGHPIQKNTTVSIDVREDYQKKYQLENEVAKGGLISLQQEVHFHAHLIGRMLQKAVENAEYFDHGVHARISDEALKKALDEAELELNKNVRQYHAQAVETSSRNINKFLDQSRALLLPEIAKVVRLKLIQATGIIFDKDILSQLSADLAAATTASSNDYVHLDKGLGLISFIGASDNTAHAQALGAEQTADRIVYSHQLRDGQKVQALSQRQHLRTPSLPVKLHPVTLALLKEEGHRPAVVNLPLEKRIRALDHKLSATAEAQISAEYQRVSSALEPLAGMSLVQALPKIIREDVAAKLQQLQEKYHLAGSTRGEEELPVAFVYNLYTSLNKNNPLGWWDEKKTQQKQSAARLFEAVHVYNRENPDKPLCLVQNIAVNGWGEALDQHKRHDVVVWEAILMSQLASLHTVYEVLDADTQRKVMQLFATYQEFLQDPNKPLNFYSYVNSPGKYEVFAVLQQIKTAAKIKEAGTTHDKTGEYHREQVTTNVKIALATLFTQEAYSKHENGFTYQALSVFAETASLGGCKSGNERTAEVNARVAILDVLSLDRATRQALLSQYTPSGKNRFERLFNELEDAIAYRPETIGKYLDTLVEGLNVEGFQAMLSLLDQGGHSKLLQKSWIWDTNRAETIAIEAYHVSEWQAHKGLMKPVLKAFCGASSEKVSTVTKLAHGSLWTLGSSAYVAGFTTLVMASLAFPPAAALAIGLAAVAGALIGSVFFAKALLPIMIENAKKLHEQAYESIYQENREMVAGCLSV